MVQLDKNLQARFPHLAELAKSPPQTWQGLPIEWKGKPQTEPVFIKTVHFERKEKCHNCHLLGLRHELSAALLKGKPMGRGYFVEYVIAEQVDQRKSVYRLIQNRSITFTDRSESHDYVCAGELSNQRILSVGKIPSWRDASEANWPTLRGQPMFFVGQVTLIETEIAKRHLTWGKTLFVFWDELDDESVFKIVMEDADEQTAQQHYDSEA